MGILKYTSKYFLILLMAVALLPISLFEARAVDNLPVPGADVVLLTIGPDGNLVPIDGIDPISSGPNGEFEVPLPPGFPPDLPVFVLAQDPNGEGIQHLSCVAPEIPAEVGPLSTAIANAFFTFANTADLDPANIDPLQLQDFVGTLQENFNQVPLPGDSEGAVERIADAMGLNPGVFFDATDLFNVPFEDVFLVASLINQAAAPGGFDPLNGPPPPLPEDIPPGSHIPGLIPPDLLDLFAPPGFDPLLEFGADILPPGAILGDIPPEAFLLPPGLELDPNIILGDAPVIPPGLIIPEGFPLPPDAMLTPGVIFDPNFIPPPGLDLPPGLILPPDFNPELLGLNPLDVFVPDPNFIPPPGFGILNEEGGIVLPDSFGLPPGLELPPDAQEFPPPEAFIPPDLPLGFDPILPPELQPGFIFEEGALLPFGLNPADLGFIPPPDFVDNNLGGNFIDLENLPPDLLGFDPLQGFDPNDPLGGFVGPPLDANGEPIPGTFLPPGAPECGGVLVSVKALCAPPDAQFPPVDPSDPNFDPFAPPPGDGEAPIPPGDGEAPIPPGGEPPIPPGDGEAPIPPGDGEPPIPPGNGEPPVPPGGEPPIPPGNGEPPIPPGDGEPPIPPGNGEAPVPPPDGGQPPPPPLPPVRVIDTQASTLANAKTGEVLTVILAAPDGTNAKRKKFRKLTASNGVYLAGKVKANAKAVKVPIIIDPSINSEALQLTLNVNNAVVTEDIAIEAAAVQLTTQLLDDSIQVSTANTNIEIASKKVKGFLLAPGSSALEMQKAIRIKGKVSEGENGDIITFKRPRKLDLEDGIYTITFNDGANLYFGRVTIGELEIQTIRGTVLSPGGKL